MLLAQRATKTRPTKTSRARRKRQVQPALGPEKAFGQALREIRRERAISQESLALECGFDRTYVSLIERGLRSPTVRVVVGLAAVLQVKPSEIVQRMELHLETQRTAPARGRKEAARDDHATK